MEHIIVGTAGHVDHGKTALTARLTGIDTDRLPEEKRRGVTIELGFVPLDLPNGLRLGLIDVPGHERFVKNMLAGVAGVDMVMLVVAADEGVMPQTEEHLNILHLLGVKKGVLVISKCDLADAEWLELVEEQVRELVAGTTLADAPMVACSAVTGQGIDQLLEVLGQVAAEVDAKPLSGHPRLPVDRVFSKTGFGTVVTGTLWMGKLRVGDSVQIWPGGREARIRSLQVHGQPVEESVAGQRTAVNLSGVETGDAPRSSWLAATGLLRETFRLDVELRLLPKAKALPQHCRVRIHHGTAEALGRIQLLDREELSPGEACYCQLLLETPLPPLRGDRLILRSYSPMVTVAGATVLDANPPRHKRYHPEVMEQLARRAKGDPADLLRDVLSREVAPVQLKQLAKDAQLPVDEITPFLCQLEEQGSLLELDIDGETHYLLSEQAERLLTRAVALVKEYHGQYRLRGGLPMAELRSRLLEKYSVKQVNALLAEGQRRGLLTLRSANVAAPDFSPTPTEKEAQWLSHIQAAYEQGGFAPPEWPEVVSELKLTAAQGGELLLYLTERHVLLRCGEVLFARTAVEQAEALLRQNYAVCGFTLAQARDTLSSSRKFVLPLLEYFDMTRLTRREGESRFFAE